MRSRIARVFVGHAAAGCLAAGVLAVAGAACTSTPDVARGGAPDSAVTTPPQPATLEGGTWRLLLRQGTAASAASNDVRPAIRFAEGRTSGTGGCNRISAPYAVTGDSLVLQAVISTQMSCGDEADRQERRFVTALQQVRRFARRGDTLDLIGAAGDSLLRLLVEPPRPLVGTTWSATGINNGAGGVASLVAGSTVTAQFAEGGRLSGSAGCNRYTAPFTVGGGDSLALGAGASTRRLCTDASVMQQEQHFLATFAQVARYVIDDDVLEWRSPDGALLARFVASP